MTDQQQPKFFVVGVAHADGTVYRIERTSDRAVCGADPSYTLDDGAKVPVSPRPRQWVYPEDASRYLAHLENRGPALDGDASIIWIPPVAEPSGIDWSGFEVLGNIDIAGYG